MIVADANAVGFLLVDNPSFSRTSAPPTTVTERGARRPSGEAGS